MCYYNSTSFNNMFEEIIIPTATGDSHNPSDSPSILELWLGTVLMLLTTMMDYSH